MASSLLSSLAVTKSSSQPDTYHSTTLWRPRGARGVFGGHVIALALVASGKTISSSMGLHSQHCYFILPANPDITIDFKVERLRDGKSYSTRSVRADQDGKTVFILVASYATRPKGMSFGQTPFSFIPSERDIKKKENESSKNEPAVSHSLRFAVTASSDEKVSKGSERTTGRQHERKGSGQSESLSQERQDDSSVPAFSPKWHLPFPSGVTKFEDSVAEEERWCRFLETKAESVNDKARKYIEEYIQERKESPVCIAVARRDSGQPRDMRMLWLQARLSPGEKPSEEDIKAMIGYTTDFQYIGTAARSIGLTSASTPRLGMLATLDHTTHYYPFPEDFDASQPMLHVMQTTIADVDSGRGMVRGLVYAQKGELIAVTSQEGVVRADMRGLGERGVTEGGGFEGKAKL